MPGGQCSLPVSPKIYSLLGSCREVWRTHSAYTVYVSLMLKISKKSPQMERENLSKHEIKKLQIIYTNLNTLHKTFINKCKKVNSLSRDNFDSLDRL